jgi:hypothetical protein
MSHCATYKLYGDEGGDGIPPDPAEFVDILPGAVTSKSRLLPHSTAESRKEDASESGGPKTCKLALHPPQMPQWQGGDAFCDDDRPEGIEQSDWLQLMRLRWAKIRTAASPVSLLQLRVVRLCVQGLQVGRDGAHCGRMEEHGSDWHAC